MILLLLLLGLTAEGGAQRLPGRTSSDSCQCSVNSSLWSFPVLSYEAVQLLVHTCEDSLSSLHNQVKSSRESLPAFLVRVQNLTARLEPHRYLSNMGVYTDLGLRELALELEELQTDIASVHTERQTALTHKLTQEVDELRRQVEKMHLSDTINMEAVKGKLRTLKNGLASCKTIPQDFISKQGVCSQALLSGISSPVVTRVSPYGKTYLSGSWGRQARPRRLAEQEEEPVWPAGADTYWVQPLTTSGVWGTVFRLYRSYEDFMASRNHEDVAVAASYSHANAIQGPGSLLYGDAVYYNCYKSAELCRYSLRDKSTARLALPGSAGHDDAFPYCYYDCSRYSDVDLAADETGLWAIYATVGNHGNVVLSRLDVGGGGDAFNVTHTWTTRLFKRAVTNAFVACGVLYATRYVDEGKEEVFYAFDTATGRDDDTLALPLEKVAKGVAALSYNPVDRRVYMYNDGYLLAYDTRF